MRGMPGENQGRKRERRMIETLDYRRDIRTIRQFEKQIKARTAKEKFLIDVAKREWIFRGHQAEIFDYGVDNRGGLITDTHAPFRDPDYRAIIDGYEFLLDVKNSGVFYKCTFVADRLRHYVSVGAFLLLFYNTGFIENNHKIMKWNECYWTLIRPKYIHQMLNDHPIINGGPKWGNKPVILVESDNYHKYFTPHQLTFMRA